MEGSSVDLLVIGTGIGVFYSTSDSGFTNWSEMAPDLPTVDVFDMEYDAVDDVLVAGTLGRGAWILRNVAAEFGSSSVVSSGAVVSSASVEGLMSAITTTGSTAPIYRAGERLADDTEGGFTPQTAQSGPLINVDDFRADPRFAGIDGTGYSVVVLDTGIDLDHSFFGPDLDSNGIADRIVYSYDFADGDADATDFNGHGSNVTSIATSSDSTHTGMAPGANIIHLKVFTDGGSGNFGFTEAALQWVVQNVSTYNIASVNMSLGDGNNFASSQSLYGISDELAALASLDVIVASSAGNDFFTHTSVPGVAYPAADGNSLAVGAVFDASIGGFSYGSGAIANSSGADRLAPFSQRHTTLTEVFAPGAAITGASASGGTYTSHGTSQASPHIAGIAALAQQLAQQTLGRRLTLAEFRQLLVDSNAAIFDGDDEDDNVTNTNQSYGRVDVFALGEAILALGGGNKTAGNGFWTVTVGPGETVQDVDFGNRLVNPLPETLTVAEGFAFIAPSGDSNDTQTFSGFVGDAFIGAAGDIDSFYFAPQANSTVTVTVNRVNGSVTPAIAVYDSVTGEQVASNIATGNSAQLTFAGEMWHRYIVAVADDNLTDTGDVEIFIEDSGAYSFSMISIGGDGVGSVSGFIDNVADIDALRFTAPANSDGNLTVVVTPSNGLNAATILLDSNGNELAKAYLNGPNVVDTITYAGVTPGAQYTLVVNSVDYATQGNFGADIIFGIVPPEISLDVSPATVEEDGATNLVYTFTRSGETDAALTVNFDISGSGTFNTDYTEVGAASFSATVGTVTFAAGSSTATVTVDPTADTAVEADETVILTIASGAGYTIATPNTATGTIANDDTKSA